MKQNLAVMATNIEYIKKDVAEIKQKIAVDYVTKIEFETRIKIVERLAYGVVGLILTAVVIGGITLLFR